MTTPMFADQQDILQNIRPIGQVNTTTPSSAASSPAAVNSSTASTAQTPTAAASGSQPAKTQSAEEKGQAVYQQYCVVCHSTGAAGAPKVGDAAAWKPRIAEGMTVLVQHAMQGYKLMPPKGTCIACTQEDITDAVKYMVSKSQ